MAGRAARPQVQSGAKAWRRAHIPKDRPRRDVDPVSSYAWDVLHGRIVAGRLIVLACERHFHDLTSGAKRGLRFSLDHAKYALDFFRLYLRHSKGEWAGRPVTLEPWQEFHLGSVFGWLRADGSRRFNTAYVEIARKNGKSLEASGVGIFGLVADNEMGAEIYSAATRRDQARIIFDEARRMVRASPDLRDIISIFKLNLSVDMTGSKFEPLSADERTLDGLNPSIVLLDELHKQRTRAVFDVLATAQGARRSPLMWIITTAGDDNPQTVYASEHAHARNVAEGVFADDSYFSAIYTLDREDRWDDQRVWIKANPNLGISVKLANLKSMALKAKHSPADLNAFKRLRLNMRTSSVDALIDPHVWAKNSSGKWDPDILRGQRFFAGLDTSSKIDLSAFVKLYPPDGERTRWMIVPRFWMPHDTIESRSDRDRVQYQRFVDLGQIEVTPGNTIDQREIREAVVGDCQQGECISCAYDPWNSTQLAILLAEADVPMAEFVQGIRSYTAPTKELLALLADFHMDHGDNDVLSWMATNLMVQMDKNENMMPSKKHSTARIDGMTALIMAIGRSMVMEQTSYLEDEEPLSF